MKTTNSELVRTLLPLSFSIPLAALVTATLIMVMHQLVQRDFVPPTDTAYPKIPEIFLEKRKPSKPIREPLIKPTPISQPPEIPETKTRLKSQGNEKIEAPNIKIAKQKISITNAAGNYPVAQVFSSPRYPHRALSKGIEGWATVRFDINKFGYTENQSVIESNPEGYFERAAIEAAKRWKYQPFLDEKGEPKPFRGMTKKLVFEIEGEA